jgi:hypothetical protein
LALDSEASSCKEWRILRSKRSKSPIGTRIAGKTFE